MATKQDVLSFIKSNFQLVENEPDFFQGICEFDNGRSQLFFVEVAEGYMTFSSPFAPIGSLDAMHVLDVVSNNITMGIQLFNGNFVVHHYVPLADVDTTEIEIGMQLTASLADTLELHFFGTDNL